MLFFPLLAQANCQDSFLSSPEERLKNLRLQLAEARTKKEVLITNMMRQTDELMEKKFEQKTLEIEEWAQNEKDLATQDYRPIFKTFSILLENNEVLDTPVRLKKVLEDIQDVKRQLQDVLDEIDEAKNDELDYQSLIFPEDDHPEIFHLQSFIETQEIEYQQIASSLKKQISELQEVIKNQGK